LRRNSCFAPHNADISEWQQVASHDKRYFLSLLFDRANRLLSLELRDESAARRPGWRVLPEDYNVLVAKYPGQKRICLPQN
jgi:hypothetical protein